MGGDVGFHPGHGVTIDVELEPDAGVVPTEAVQLALAPSVKVGVALRRQKTDVGAGEVEGRNAKNTLVLLDVADNPTNDPEGDDLGVAGHGPNGTEVALNRRFFEVGEAVGDGRGAPGVEANGEATFDFGFVGKVGAKAKRAQDVVVEATGVGLRVPWGDVDGLCWCNIPVL